MIRIVLLSAVLLVSVMGQKNSSFETYLNELTDEFNIPQIRADSLGKSDIVLLDTRGKKEYMVSHLEKAMWVGYDDFDLSLVDSLEYDRKIVVYCSVGYRSSKIARILIDAGFSNVSNLYGGIFKWANENRLMVSENDSTNKIHTYNEHWGRFITNPQIVKVH